MSGKLHRYLAGDHERLDALLDRAMSDPENIDAAAYAQFSWGLLKQSRQTVIVFVRWQVPARQLSRTRHTQHRCLRWHDR